MLGLLIERPDSAGGLGRRLVERFSSAQFARSAPHNALRRLVEQGFVAPLPEHGRTDPAVTRYAATPQGLARFRAWLRAASAAAPALREELQAKIEFCAPRELPLLIEAVGAEERACASMFAAAQGRLGAAELLGVERATGSARWTALTRATMLRDEATMWGMRFKRLERLRARLEELRAEAERCARLAEE